MRLHHLATTSLAALALSACATVPATPVASAPPAPEANALAAAPVSELVERVSIPYQQFKLANGLTVLVHEDRKAPVVAVSMWYGVGSKHEPRGKTGFAHLFEHLMFNGSENSPGDFFEPLQEVGATDFNGTTWFDRTNYFQTVPTGALDRTLMLESDRMGHLLGAVTQEKLDNQIGVVQNEKRQGDNQPYGLIEYEQLENLYPSGHPYHHSTIGSMDDLSGATLDDVKQWFRDNYGPNNAILVLAGDIDAATARAKVERWFGDIPAGPAVPQVAAPVPTLAAPLTKTIYDQVATPRIYRMWAVPGLDNPDYLPLVMGASVLGGLASSRLDNALVRGQELAVRVTGSADIYAQAGQLVFSADAKPGVDAQQLGAALDAELARFIAQGPTADELQRAATVFAAEQIRGLERVGGFSGKAPTLAEGLLYSGNPAEYRVMLERAARLTPEEVRSVFARWASRPVFALTVEPGTRREGGENRGGFIVAPEGLGARPAFYADPVLGTQGAAGAVTAADRSTLPPVGELRPLEFPAVERATLSNGMEVYFARRSGVPVVSTRITFNAGHSADRADRLGIQSMMLAAMDEGTTALDPQELAIAKERLGANISASANADTTNFSLDALSPNLGASFALLADYIRHPAFAPAAVERVRTQQVTRIRNELNDPNALAQRALMATLYGQHPYAVPPSGTGNAEVAQSASADELRAFHQQWIRPDNARIFVVGDTSLGEVTRLLETSFGDWRAPATPLPAKAFGAAIPTQSSRIVLIDRPSSPQSVIMAGRVLGGKGTDDMVPLDSANYVYGGNFLSRINMNLRETKGWSYGVRSSVTQPLDRNAFIISAPVQADRTGESITELRRELADYTSARGVTEQELGRLVNSQVRALPGRYETNASVLSGIAYTVNYGLPDDYWTTLPARYRGLTSSQLGQVASGAMRGDDLVYVVVGDASVVRPQLERLGLPVEVRPAAGAQGGN